MKIYRKLFAVLLISVISVIFIAGCGLNGDNTEMNNSQNSEISSQKDSETEKSESGSVETQGTEFESENTESQNSESDVLNETEAIMYAQTTVNVRKGPGTSYDVLGKLTTNDEITALGQPAEDWQKVLYNGETAYVSAKYLGTSKVEVLTPDTPPAASSGNELPEITEVPDLHIYEPAEGGNGYLIVIDAGHQGKGNSNKEPDGPGSSTMKAKVTSGTSGCVSGWDEYQLNLVVSLKLKEELLARGYRVAMIRETHEINISNMTRAEAANKLGADAFIRIHANSSTDSSVYGALTACQTAANPYNADLYAECRRLSDCVLDGFVEATGAYKRSVWETDTMSGINWCKVPVTIVEMGFMSNPQEDTLMATDEYQNKMVQGMANGIDAYFGQ